MSTMLLRGQLSYAKQRGFEVVLLCAPGPEATACAAAEGVALLEVPMEREIAPMQDIVALWRVINAVRRARPSIVNAGTPKAGLLVIVAAWLSRVPARIYTLRGLRFETTRGFRRHLLVALERLVCGLAHRVICISPSLRSEAIRHGLVAPDKATVLGSGSSNGVNSEHFAPTAQNKAQGELLRQQLGIPKTALTIGFVGRLVEDKGVRELVAAWESLREEFPELHLIIVGPTEAEGLASEMQERLRGDGRVHYVGRVDDTAPSYAAMDVLVHPTYREGFGNVLLEASSMGLPVVATRVAGCVDAVRDGVTGILVPPRDPRALVDAVRRYLRNPDLRREHGEAGRRRAVNDFRQEVIWEGLCGEYFRLLSQRTVVGDRSRDPKAVGPRARATSVSEKGRGQLWAKRAIDILISGVGLVVVAPVLLCIATAVLVTMGRPVLFRQQRPGLGGKPFWILKFRTMRVAEDGRPSEVSDGERITALGRLLRETSLDELPELVNVLKGDMSLVGPRPLLMEYLDRYTPEQMRRHEVKPGITGWAQVNGRNALTWEEKFKLDVWYVDNMSLWLDLKIIAMTIWKVLRCEGISQPGHATMEEFKGSAS